jgi:metallo-beta-lactamase family protein
VLALSQSIRFCGAAETVTGSRHLLELQGKRYLVDCGIFQGPREIRERNWVAFPVPPDSLDAVIATHAHLDHIGWLPRLVSQGYTGPIFATSATVALARLSLPDSGRLQEEEAQYRNRHGLTRHEPALPLYSEEQAYACLKQFVPLRYDEWRELSGKVGWRFLPAGHILGSAFVDIVLPSGETLLMSGDLGRFDTPLILDPTPVKRADYLVVESTYGDRLHAHEDPEAKLAGILQGAWEEGSCVLVPSFAIGRTQELLYYLKRLQDTHRMKPMPIYVDSPMASTATLMYIQHSEEHDKEARLAFDERNNPIAPADMQWVRDHSQSKALNGQPGPMIVIAGSGMCQGGRIVHHLRHRLSHPATIVVFTGYQAQGTLGRLILERATEVSILGENVPVRARIEKLNSLSAHADQGEILRWMRFFEASPKRTFFVHGEPPAQAGLKEKIEGALGWDCVIPKHLESFDL